MKKLILTSLFLIYSVNFLAQEIKTTVDKIANETCIYFKTNEDELKKLSSNERVAKLGIKMLSLYDKYREDLKKEGITVDISDDTSTEAFGEKIGFSMAKFCTEVLIALSEDIPDEDLKVESFIEGELKTISGKELSIVSLKDKKGKTQKFVWINNFEGSDRLINSENIKGINVKLTYINIELYSPLLKEYIVRKQITKIEYFN